jgi:hypothetical protein
MLTFEQALEAMKQAGDSAARGYRVQIVRPWDEHDGSPPGHRTAVGEFKYAVPYPSVRPLSCLFAWEQLAIFPTARDAMAALVSRLKSYGCDPNEGELAFSDQESFDEDVVTLKWRPGRAWIEAARLQGL